MASGASSIRAVVFDCGGVLVEDCPTLCFVHLAQRYPESERARVKNGHQNNYSSWNKFKIDKSFREVDYWKEVIAHDKLNESVDDMKKFLRDSLLPYSPAIEVARHLKAKGIPVGIMSNHSEEWFDAIAHKFGFYDIFDPKLVVVSQAVAAAKPDTAIMDVLVQRLAVLPGLHKNEVLFIDDKKANVEAAQQYGFKAFVHDAGKDPIEHFWTNLAAHGIHK